MNARETEPAADAPGWRVRLRNLGFSLLGLAVVQGTIWLGEMGFLHVGWLTAAMTAVTALVLLCVSQLLKR